MRAPLAAPGRGRRRLGRRPLQARRAPRRRARRARRLGAPAGAAVAARRGRARRLGALGGGDLARRGEERAVVAGAHAEVRAAGGVDVEGAAVAVGAAIGGGVAARARGALCVSSGGQWGGGIAF